MHIAIAGCGHAALVALDGLARRPLPPGTTLTVVSEDETAPYSGMLPGWVEGLYAADALHVPIAPVVERAGGRFLRGAVAGLDADARILRLSDGRAIAFDVAVLNTGSRPSRPGGDGAPPLDLPAKPIPAFQAGVEALHAALAGGAERRLAIVGAGAGGSELALAFSALAVGERLPLSVHLVEAGPAILSGLPPAVRRKVRRKLEARGVAIATGVAVERLEPAGLVLSNGGRIACDAVVWATPGGPPGFLADSGLARDDRGFVLTDRTLRSLSHPAILAVGDVGTVADAPRPKAGVWSVRAGPPLGEQLRAIARGERPRPVRLQREALVLMATGFRRAIGTRNGITLEGTLVWRLKDRIDRAFVDRFRSGPPD